MQVGRLVRAQVDEGLAIRRPNLQVNDSVAVTGMTESASQSEKLL
jgi:hypothetical protein